MSRKSLIELYIEKRNNTGSVELVSQDTSRVSLTDIYEKAGGIQIKEKYTEELRDRPQHK